MRDAPQLKLLMILVLIALAMLIVPIACMVYFDRPLITTAELGSSAEIIELKKKGWIPESLPETVTDFHEAHSIDTSYTIMRFDYDGDVDQLTSGACVRTDNLKVAEKELGGLLFTNDWWPFKELKSEVARGAWPVYDCRFEGDYKPNFWLMRSPQQRFYMWRQVENNYSAEYKAKLNLQSPDDQKQ